MATQRRPRYAAAKAETMASFAAFTRGEVDAPRYPLEVFLEVSNLCNARCVMCDVFSALNPDRLDRIRTEERAHMLHADHILEDEELFAHALLVHLYGFGEPTIHPRFQELVRRVGQYEVLVDFFTNGMKLADEGLIDTLIEAQVEQLVLSFSGSTKEAYENVYQGCSWDTVLGGLGALARKKQAAGSQYPRVHVNSLGWAHHLETLEDFVVLMADHGVSVVEVKQLLPSGRVPIIAPHVGRTRTAADLERMHRARATAERLGVQLALHHGLGELTSDTATATGELVPVERLRERAAGVEINKSRPAPRPKARLPAGASYAEIHEHLGPRMDTPGFHCMEPFKTLYVRQEGLTKACCFMLDRAPALGDVTEARGLDAWRGDGHRAMREAALASAYPVETCSACINNDDGPKAHSAELVFSRYGLWFQSAFGERFAADLGALVLDSPTIGALHAYSRAAQELPGKPLFQGFLDHVFTDSVDGWVWAPRYPELRVPVVIWWKGRPVVKTVANQWRPDVEALGRGDGRYGFRVAFPEWIRVSKGDVIFATAGSDDQPLGTSPQRAVKR